MKPGSSPKARAGGQRFGAEQPDPMREQGEQNPPITPYRVRELLGQIVAETDRIDLRRYETAARDVLVAELVPLVCEALDRTIRFAEQLEGQASGSHTTQEVSDCAFMVRLELIQRRNRIETLIETGESVDVLIGCDGALRNCVKCMRALGHATGERASVLPGYDSDLLSGLRVRKAYARFRRQVSRLSDPERSEPQVRLRLLHVRTLTAAFLCGEAHALMRVADRHAIREFQARMAQWLKQGAPNPVEGLKIWKDFQSYVDLLRQVNRREVLIRHDQSTIRELLRQREHGAASDFHDRLASLSGLDATLDMLLERSEPARREEIWPILQRLAEELGVTAFVG